MMKLIELYKLASLDSIKNIENIYSQRTSLLVKCPIIHTLYALI